ncbi:hypothetical protein ACOME3_002912 [Neoechinorhynchus agilis]
MLIFPHSSLDAHRTAFLKKATFRGEKRYFRDNDRSSVIFHVDISWKQISAIDVCLARDSENILNAELDPSSAISNHAVNCGHQTDFNDANVCLAHSHIYGID